MKSGNEKQKFTEAKEVLCYADKLWHVEKHAVQGQRTLGGDGIERNGRRRLKAQWTRGQEREEGRGIFGNR